MVLICRIHEAKLSGDKVVDMDGSYLSASQRQWGQYGSCGCSKPTITWLAVYDRNKLQGIRRQDSTSYSRSSCKDKFSHILHQVDMMFVTSQIFSQGVGPTVTRGTCTFCAFTHRSSGRMHRMEATSNTLSSAMWNVPWLHLLETKVILPSVHPPAQRKRFGQFSYLWMCYKVNVFCLRAFTTYKWS